MAWDSRRGVSPRYFGATGTATPDFGAMDVAADPSGLDSSLATVAADLDLAVQQAQGGNMTAAQASIGQAQTDALGVLPAYQATASAWIVQAQAYVSQSPAQIAAATLGQVATGPTAVAAGAGVGTIIVVGGILYLLARSMRLI